MSKKLYISLRELISISKDYSGFSKEELRLQYDIIKNKYDDIILKTNNAINQNINSKILELRNIQKGVQNKMYSNIIKELDDRLNIIKNLISK